MSYISDFILSLSEEEIPRIRSLRLIGKEEEVMDELIFLRNSKNYDLERILQKLNLTKNHFDKISSVLLDKVLVLFFKSEYEKLFSALHHKGLTKLLIHELTIVEKKILKLRDNLEAIKFYKVAFDSSCKIYYPNFSRRLSKKFGDKYLQSKGDNITLEDRVYIDLSIHVSFMISQCFAGNEDVYRKKAKAFFDKWQKQLNNGGSNFSLFFFHLSLSSYFKFFGTDVAPFIEALELSYSYLMKCDKEIQDEYRFKILCEIGFGYCEMGNYSNSYKMYENAFKKITDTSNIGYYQKYCYVSICLINKDYSNVLKLFDKFLSPYLKSGVNKSLQFDVLFLGLIIHLHLKDFSEAYNFLEKIKSYKKSEVTNQAKYLIRVAENLYFYKYGDYKFSLVLAQRNIKYASRPENINDQFDYYKSLFQCLHSFSKAILAGNSTSKELKQLKSNLKGGMYESMNILI